jgi:hypothetical protein
MPSTEEKAAPMTSQNRKRRSAGGNASEVLQDNQPTTAAAWKPFLTNAGDTPKCC